MQGHFGRVVAAVVGVTLALAFAAPAEARVTRFSGVFTCIDYGADNPLEGARVELWARGWEWLPSVVAGHVAATGTTDARGYFTLTSEEPEDNYFARVVLMDRNHVHVKDWEVPWVWFADTASRRNDVSSQWIGGLHMFDVGYHSPPCAIWRAVRAGAEGLRTDGIAQPFPDLLITTSDVLTGGVPYTAHTAINWPPGFQAGSRPGMVDKGFHEFAHALRQGLDGNLGHFLFDATRFNYLRNHAQCFDGGRGFAFNEGWAEYWSGEITAPPNCRDDDGTPFAPANFGPAFMLVEGNVAGALQRTQDFCHLTRAQMVRVLEANPDRIHSFEEYQARVQEMFHCTAPAATEPEDHSAQIAQSVSLRQRELHLHAVLHDLSAATSSLSRDLRDARRADRRAGHCRSTPCDVQIHAATLPPVLAGELATVRLIRHELRPFDTDRELKRMRRPTPRVIRAELRMRSHVLAGTVRIERRMLEQVIRAARAAGRIDPDGLLEPFLADMQGKLAALNAGKSSALMSMSLPHLRNVLKPFDLPDPEAGGPPPSGDQGSGSNNGNGSTSPTQESLALSCPSGGSAANPIHVSGSLSPAVSGGSVTITWTNGKQQGTNYVALAGDGSFSSDLTSFGAGTYTVTASFGGDASHTSASAQCTVELK